MLKRLIISLALTAGLGCATIPGRRASVDLEGIAYEKAWQATLDVIRARFPLAETSKEKGLIATDYRIRRGQDDLARLARLPSGVLKGAESLYTHRWKADARVSSRDHAVRVSLRVIKERLEPPAAFEASPQMFDQPSFTQQRAAASAYGGEPYGEGPLWTEVGRDREMERELLAEIRRKLKSE